MVTEEQLTDFRTRVGRPEFDDTHGYRWQENSEDGEYSAEALKRYNALLAQVTAQEEKWEKYTKILAAQKDVRVTRRVDLAYVVPDLGFRYSEWELGIEVDEETRKKDAEYLEILNQSREEREPHYTNVDDQRLQDWPQKDWEKWLDAREQAWWRWQSGAMAKAENQLRAEQERQEKAFWLKLLLSLVGMGALIGTLLAGWSSSRGAILVGGVVGALVGLQIAFMYLKLFDVIEKVGDYVIEKITDEN